MRDLISGPTKKRISIASGTALTRSNASFRFVLIVAVFAVLMAATLVASGRTGDFVGAQSGNGRYDTDGDGLIEITNLEQLDAIRHDGNGRADAGDTYWNGGKGWLTIFGSGYEYFNATFDGGRHTISNLYMGRDDTSAGAKAIPSVGGLVGSNSNGSIITSYATGSVTSTVTDNERSARVGGLAGGNEGFQSTDSYATGRVNSSGDAHVGGLTGDSFPAGNSPTDFSDGSITNSYSTGRVTSSSSDNVGGLVGFDHRSSITDSYWNTQTSGQSSNDGGTGKTIRELQSPTVNTGIFANWDSAIWDFGASTQYPTLRSGASATPTPSGSIATDRAALVALYNATGGPNWTNKDNWLTDRPLEEWYGVSVVYGRVRSLYLIDNQLVGEIPPELGNLDNLVQLELQDNQLVGEIPPEFGNLDNLVYVHLHRNQLTGEMPPELGNLTNLTGFALHGNQLTGEIPSELGDLVRLIGLNLGDNQLTGEIPPELGNLTNITTLQLEGNQLTGEIPPELGNLTSLVYLYLYGNQLTGEIPPELGNLAFLEGLSLGGNQLSGEIPPWLGDFANLTILQLDGNQLTGEIPPELGNLTNLEVLFLSGNQLTGCVPAGLRDVSGNDFTALGLPFCGDTPGSGDYDADDDGLIEVANLAQLNAIRWDLDGDGVTTDSGYGAAFPGAISGMGCPGSGCTGYELTANLDFDTNGNGRADAGDTYWNGGEGWLPIGHGISDSNPNAFGATFDGGGRTISNLYINRGSPRNLGLFGWVDSDATIRRVGVISVDVTGVLPVDQSGSVGGLVGLNYGAITDSYATGSVGANDSHMGGLAGINQIAGTITGSHAAVNLALSVTGNQGSTPSSTRIHTAGGLVGYNDGNITDSYATGNVSGNVGNRIGEFGGLAGHMCGGAITNSYATGNVAGEATGSGFGMIGGLVGASASGNITNSYATGGLAGSGSNASAGVQDYIITNLVEDDAGGFITASYAGSIEPGQSNTDGVPNRVTGSGNVVVGGLVGVAGICKREGVDLPASTATDSYWDTQTSGQSSSDGGIGKTTRELQSPTSNTGIYANWDPAVWGFGTSSQYPALKSGARTATPSDACLEDLGTLTADVSRAGTWTSGCASVTKSGNYARLYSFTLGQEMEVTIDLTSSEDTVLNLLRGAGPDGDVIASNDDVESGNTDSQIVRTLEAGAYTIEATTFDAGVPGSFNLSVARTDGTGEPEPAPPDSCIDDLGTLTASTSQAGTWTRDCPSSSEPNTFARYYSFTLGAETGVTVDLVSQRDTVLYLRGPVPGGELFNDDVELGNSNSQVSATLPAGAYTLEASTYAAGQTGDFTLTITLAGDTGTPGNYDSDGDGTIELPELFDAIDDYFAGDIPLTALFDVIDSYFSGAPVDGAPGEGTCVETVTGSEPVSGEWTAGCESSEPGRGHTRYYTFTLDRFTDVTITLTRVSGDADPYLYLRRGTGQSGASLRENDGREGDPTVSEISARLSRGTYTAEATTYSAGQTGSFTLSIAQPETDYCLEELRSPLVDTVGFPGRKWDSACVSGEREGSYAKYFRFTLDREAAVTITLESQDADTYLYLREGEAQSGAHLADNDDLSANPRNTNSRIIRTLAAGTYTIEATTLAAGQSGNFNLTITGPPGPQRAALLALYEATGGDNWFDNTNWGSNELVREWYGVDTDEQGLVIGLDLGNNRLRGEIPADLDWSAFTHLEWLNLGHNRLTGAIPSSLAELPILKNLNLSYNQLEGQIPADLGNEHLTLLYLNGNQLSGSIPSQWGSGSSVTGGLPSLRLLNLSRNRLSGRIPDSLGNLAALRWLDLGLNHLHGDIPSSLGNLSNLRGLLLGHNRLSGNIPSSLGNLSNLRELYLDHQNPFRGQAVSRSILNNSSFWLTGSIPPTLGNLSNLEMLFLNNNRLSGSIPSDLGGLGSLALMNLGNNSLTGSIPGSLGDLGSLTSMNLSNNSISGIIPGSLGELEGLRLLNLENNQLSGEIPATLGKLSNLIILWVSGNPFDRDGCIPEALRQITNHDLESLRLIFCDEVVAPPPEPEPPPPAPPVNHAGDEAALLALISNTGSDASGKLKGITSYNGKACTFGNTEIPLGEWCGVKTDDDGRVTDLVLNGKLFDGELQGNIPPGLGGLSELFRLDFSHNRLSGGIPPELGNLSNLSYLNLSHNRGSLFQGNPGLSGEIPSELSSLGNLGVLRLQGNSFTSIDPELALPDTVRVVDFSNNNIRGSIESALFQLAGSRPLNSEMDLHVNDNEWWASSEAGQQWTGHSGEVALLEVGDLTLTASEIDEILEGVDRVRDAKDRLELGYEILTSSSRDASLKLGKAVVNEALGRIGLTIVKSPAGLAKLYYDVTIGQNPLVQQAARGFLFGAINGWSPAETQEFIVRPVFSVIGYHCSRGGTFQAKLNCVDAGGTWHGR